MGAGLEASELAVGADKALLHHVFRVLLVAGHPEGELERATAVALDEGPEGLAVPLPGPRKHGGDFGRVHSGS